MTPLDQAYAHCQKLAAAHYENFPVASLLLGREQRRAVAAVYAFARQADDYADEPQFGPEARRLELLDAWAAKLDDPQGDPVFVALEDARGRHGIEKRLLLDLVSAFRQDVTCRSYRTWGDVLDYCRRSANPVGRIVLAVHGRLTPDNAALSDSICTGLQLANFWQDLRSDVAVRGRLYLPEEDVLRFNVELADLTEGNFTPALRSLMMYEVARTRRCFDQGAALPARLPGMLGMEIRLTVLGGRAILDAIEAQGFDTLARRPKLGKLAWARLAARALAGREA